MTTFDTIEQISQEITSKLNSNTDKKSIALLYAFNATWKTRLSVEFNNLNNQFQETESFEDEDDETEIPDIKVLSYNAFIEDLFSWDNESYILKFNSHWLLKFIEKQEIEWNIKDIYKEITSSKIEPNFDYTNSRVTFPIITVIDENNTDEQLIKISKSEESIFIWSIYFSILSIAIESLNMDEDDRQTKKFNNLELIVIDDPVSSIDDTWIITIADKLFNLIKSYKGQQLNFLLTTHHSLFYNILFNSFKRINNFRYKDNWFPYVLSKNNDNRINLDLKNYDTPFSYHISTISIIKKAIENNNIERYHFNLFRSLLEKTTNFLWKNGISHCVLWERKSLHIKIINMYSHGKVSELEYNQVQDSHKELFEECFNQFLTDFKYN